MKFLISHRVIQKKREFKINIPNKCLLLFFTISYSCNEYENRNKNIQALHKKDLTINYTLLKSFPHDTTSFTEGLFVLNKNIFESTGSPTELPQTSSLFGIIDTINGKINAKVVLDKKNILAREFHI